MLPIRTLLSFSCALLAVTLRASEPGGPLIPLEDFFADAEIKSVQVAPDGRHIAWLSPVQGITSLMLFDLDTGKPDLLARPNDENIAQFFWKGSDRIVYGGDLGGNESQALVAVDIKTKKFTHLADSYKEGVNEDAATARIVDSLRFDPNHLLIEGRSSRRGLHFELALLDVRNGERVSVGGADKDTKDWVTDATGVVRARARVSGDEEFLEARPDGRSGFVRIAETPLQFVVYGKSALFEPLSFNANLETLYIVRHFADKPGSALFAFNTHTMAWGEPLFQTDEGEISSVILSWDRTKLLGISCDGEKEPRVQWLDAGREKLERQIKATLPPGLFTRIVSTSQDEKIFVVSARSDVNPGIYFLLDLRGKPQFVQLGRVNGHVDPAALQPMQPISYTARDGQAIHGYLTLPKNAEGHRVPLILHPHGGPFGIRDDWRFDPEVQFLASRGYAVLQPNYRGSGGYGVPFLWAGHHEYGGKMQDDLTDAVKWAIDRGIADPARVCISGASYGGYAALAGVTFTPDLYCCAVNYVGVSDLAIVTSPGRFGGNLNDNFIRTWIGADHDTLFNHSPVNFVERIRVPTLHAYGENDPRVVMKNWTELEAELKRFNKPYESVREENEGHGFQHESARIAFYRKMEQFLAANLAPKTVERVEVGPLKTLDLPAK